MSDFKELLKELNKEIKGGAKTFNGLSSKLREKIDRDLPSEIVYKKEGVEQIELIKNYVGLFLK